MLEGLFSIHIISPLKCDPPSPHPSSTPPPKKKCFPQRENTQISLLILIINFISTNLKNFTHLHPPCPNPPGK